MADFPYKNPELPVEERLQDLLGRMTREEKVGQLLQLDARTDYLQTIRDRQPGSLLHILGEDTRKAIEEAANTRLGIPIIFGEDAIHGHSFWPGATIFPSQLALATSWNPELLSQVAEVVAREVRTTGPKMNFSPVLCLMRDLRWGRVNETFGEDPFLIGVLGEAMIQGYQGDNYADNDRMLATAKHYAGYSETQGGRDASEADLGKRKLLSYFLPPFERAAKSGCMSFMTGYQSIEGVPSTANRWLLTDVLKEQWGFEGILVTDWDNVGRMVWEQKTCPDYKIAAVRALKAGNDLIMATPQFYEGALEALEEGLISDEELDAVVSRMLRLKFELGLFEDPGLPDAEAQQRVIACEPHRQLNLEAARQSITLLKNEGVLPLPIHGGAKTIAVIGPNADDDLNQLGDWSLGSAQMEYQGQSKHPRECTTTLLDGVKSVAPADWTLLYEKGCDIQGKSNTNIAAAVQTAREADYVVLAVGDNLQLTGEEKSTATLELQGDQNELIDAVMAVGKPVILTLVSGKPLVLPKSAEKAAAMIACFNPGMQGGRAFAEILWGAINPGGRLTISWPRHVGQQPTFYSQVRGQHGDRYADLTQDPLYAFGEGISYTNYEYSELTIGKAELSQDEFLECSIKVSNTGKVAGWETVQLYVSDRVTSVTWVNKQLKAFEKIHLDAGECKTVSFKLPVSDFWLIDADCNKVVEAGEFEVQVGHSSRDQDLLKAVFTVVQPG